MVNKNGTIEATYTISGNTYLVVQTKRGASNKVWDARDTIINVETGVRKEKTRREWQKYFNNLINKQNEKS